MIPLYVQDTYGRWTAGLPAKNPIYFIRKSMGRYPLDALDVAILNTDDMATSTESFPAFGGVSWPYNANESPKYFTPPAVQLVHDQPLGNPYDVESINAEHFYSEFVEPRGLGGGSHAAEPLDSHAIITINGFVRGNSYNDLYQKISFLNYSFDPVINYLEGSSTFDNTIVPTWQPFENAGFNILAWYDPHFRHVSEDALWEGEGLNPFSVEEYGRLNRFMFARSIATPVTMDTKFTDMNAPFSIQLLVVDPREYEFLPPSEWFGTYEFGNLGSKMFVDYSHFDLTVSTTGGEISKTSNEDFIYPDYLWRTGPGWREVSEDTPT